jgi:hypothetical protein
MFAPTSFLVTVVALCIFYASFDSGWFRSEPAPPGISAALAIFTVIFGLGAWGTFAAGDVKRSRLFSGLSVACGIYALGRMLS